MAEEKPETVKVRTTMRPEEELEVSPQEALDLKRQKLLVEEEAPAQVDGELNGKPETRQRPARKGEQA